jgi:hypothetical protein
MRTIRSNAPKLLEASKGALRYLIRQDPEPLPEQEQKRREIMALLREAVDAAEPPEFDEALTSVRLQMTTATWDALHHVLRTQAVSNRDDKLVLGAVEEGMRKTKQRIYVTLAINPKILRRLVFTLRHKPTTAQTKPFTRLAKQIEKDGLTKNPMEILGQMGL